MHRFAIAVAGASGSGKTTLAEALAAELDATLVRIDDYYHAFEAMTFEERCAVNFDHPDSVDDALLVRHVRALLAGETVDAPRYDFARFTRCAASETVAPGRCLVVEGIFALAFPALRTLCETRVFVDTPENVCLDRRIARDVHERGRTPDEVVHRFRNHVWPMYRTHVLPHRPRATQTVAGTGDLRKMVTNVVDRLPVPSRELA